MNDRDRLPSAVRLKAGSSRAVDFPFFFFLLEYFQHSPPLSDFLPVAPSSCRSCFFLNYSALRLLQTTSSTQCNTLFLKLDPIYVLISPSPRTFLFVARQLFLRTLKVFSICLPFPTPEIVASGFWESDGICLVTSISTGHYSSNHNHFFGDPMQPSHYDLPVNFILHRRFLLAHGHLAGLPPKR